MVGRLTGWLSKAWRANRNAPHDVASDAPLELVERDVTLAPLPAEFDRVLKLKSHAAPDRFYDVNLAQLACSCADHAEHRRGFAARDVRRVCKHLRMLLERRNAFDFFDEVGQAILRPSRAGSRAHTGVREVAFFACGEDVLGWEPASPWISVITRRGPSGRLERCARYTVHVGDGRWAHGAAPAAAADITRAARALVEQQRVAA
jgi:hypothetical protein